MRARLANLAVVAFAAVLSSTLAVAQESDGTVQPEGWTEAGRWAVQPWFVVALGAVLVVLVVVGLIRAIRRRRRR